MNVDEKKTTAEPVNDKKSCINILEYKLSIGQKRKRKFNRRLELSLVRKSE